MSEYIVAGEYSAYGLPAGGTTQMNVKAACALIDGHLKRPEGLVWSPDVTGQPCFMAGATPRRTWQIQSDIEPGSGVTVALDSVPPPALLGEVLVLDAPTPSSCEAAVVTAIDGSTITFATIARVHSSTSPASSGLVIAERRNVGYQGPVAFLSRTPVAQVLSIGTGWDRSTIREPSLSDDRHGVHGDYAEGIGPIPTFGGAPQWTMLDPTLFDCDLDSGKLQVRVFGARNEVKVNYLAGWTEPNLPDIVKQVCARLVIAIQNQDPDIPGGAKLYRANDTTVQRFNNSAFDDDMKFQLAPFRAKTGL